MSFCSVIRSKPSSDFPFLSISSDKLRDALIRILRHPSPSRRPHLSPRKQIYILVVVIDRRHVVSTRYACAFDHCKRLPGVELLHCASRELHANAGRAKKPRCLPELEVALYGHVRVDRMPLSLRVFYADLLAIARTCLHIGALIARWVFRVEASHGRIVAQDRLRRERHTMLASLFQNIVSCAAPAQTQSPY